MSKFCGTVNVKYLIAKDGFRLGQLVELQDFLAMWKESSFEEALDRLKERYAASANLALALKVIEQFENETNWDNGSSEYFASAFEAYLYDIEFEEFELSKAKVIVSTMHKAKGREFESVYIMVENNFISNDYQRRLLYVAITRAKQNLYIHTQDSCFKEFEKLASNVSTVWQIYKEPNDIVFTMGLGDLWLSNEDAAKGIKLTNPIAGEKVKIQKQIYEDGSVWFRLIKNGQTIGVLSKPDNGINRLSAKILQKEAKGYVLNPEAEIEYIVVHRDLKTNTTNLQALCRVHMTRK